MSLCITSKTILSSLFIYHIYAYHKKSVSPNNELFGDTVSLNNELDGDTVSLNNELDGDTVSPNNFFHNKNS